jgi:chromate transporter
MLTKLLLTFSKIGLFTYGGGLAMLPLLQEQAIEYGWLTEEQFANMIAISQSTPGPIAINMATFVGYNQAGIIGAIISSIGVILPGFLIILIVTKFLTHFNENPVVKAIFVGLRATVVGLIFTAVINIAMISIIDVDLFSQTNNIIDLFDIRSVLLFIIMLFAVIKYKKHPIYYIIFAGIIGVIIW